LAPGRVGLTRTPTPLLQFFLGIWRATRGGHYEMQAAAEKNHRSSKKQPRLSRGCRKRQGREGKSGKAMQDAVPTGTDSEKSRILEEGRTHCLYGLFYCFSLLHAPNQSRRIFICGKKIYQDVAVKTLKFMQDKVLHSFNN
jgi:hypothetical protein